jgi:hypothetical protein
VFTINAGRIEPLDVADDSLINSKKIKKVNKQIILEETKSGGFYPQGRQRAKDEELYDLDKPDDELIMEGKIDPVDWKREIDRVEVDLDNIEKEIELIRTRGKGDLTEDFEECRRHIELIIELCKDIQETCH